ncbi:MAG: hypothetical protein C0592_13150, partial [Marinilabiliales bacterium]
SNNNEKLRIISVFEVDNSLEIKFNTPFKGTHRIEIYDISGRIITHQEIMCERGCNSARIETDKSGLIIIKIMNETDYVIHKFLN